MTVPFDIRASISYTEFIHTIENSTQSEHREYLLDIQKNSLFLMLQKKLFNLCTQISAKSIYIELKGDPLEPLILPILYALEIASGGNIEVRIVYSLSNDFRFSNANDPSKSIFIIDDTTKTSLTFVFDSNNSNKSSTMELIQSEIFEMLTQLIILK